MDLPKTTTRDRSRTDRIRFVTLMIGVTIAVAAASPFFFQPARALAMPSSSSTKKRGFGTPRDQNPQSSTICVTPLVVPLQSPKSTPGYDLPVLTQEIVGLADLRYDEWMASEETANAESRSQPSRFAFRMATAEILSERSEAGSVTFVAKQQQQKQQQECIVGAAELSPIEFEGIAPDESSSSDADANANANAKHVGLYVTDVVTSSRHRRMGIANRLMDALEHYAYEHYASESDQHNKANSETMAAGARAVIVTLYLHVKADNPSARSFYSNPERGYALWDPDAVGACRFDAALLEANAGIDAGEEQALLCKILTQSGHDQLTDRIAAQDPRGTADPSGVVPAADAVADAIAATKQTRGFGAGFDGASDNSGKRNKKGKRKAK